MCSITCFPCNLAGFGGFSTVPDCFCQKHIEGKALDLPLVETLGSKTDYWALGFVGSVKTRQVSQKSPSALALSFWCGAKASPVKTWVVLVHAEKAASLGRVLRISEAHHPGLSGRGRQPGLCLLIVFPLRLLGPWESGGPLHRVPLKDKSKAVSPL